MKNKKKFGGLLKFLAVGLMLWLVLRFVIGGSEDDWICEHGQWIKHGQPSAPKPEIDCRRD
ncbi:hypothetical protein KKD62_03710 [Patescibacteria group bacterium]|nr:hypothetical protein [Patescibacteria group bacterium]MBU1931113.1 hypothetical protein [Patescibacteria group bacterium]